MDKLNDIIQKVKDIENEINHLLSSNAFFEKKDLKKLDETLLQHLLLLDDLTNVDRHERKTCVVHIQTLQKRLDEADKILTYKSMSQEGLINVLLHFETLLDKKNKIIKEKDKLIEEKDALILSIESKIKESQNLVYDILKNSKC